MTSNILHLMKCGEIYFSNNLDFYATCAFCEKLFQDFSMFKKHSLQFNCTELNKISEEIPFSDFSKTDAIFGIKNNEYLNENLKKDEALETKINKNLKSEITKPVETTETSASNTNVNSTSSKGYNKPYKCELCDKSYYMKKHLQGHIRIVHEKKKLYHCDICTNSFAYKATLCRHKQNEHNKICPYKCNKCKSEFNYYLDLIQHKKKMHPEICFECSKCKKKFLTLRKHYCTTKTESEKSKINNNGEFFVCGICDKIYKFIKSYKLHLKYHAGEKPFRCNHCDKSFITRRSLSQHSRTHNGGKPYNCRLCMKLLASECVCKDNN